MDGETIIDGNDIFGSHGSATKAKYRAVTTIVNYILNPKLTEEKIVLSLRDASTNYRVRKYFKRAGMIDSNENETMMDTCKTANIQGRATELQHNLANSVILVVASTPPAAR